MIEKACTKCGQVKPLSEFVKNRKNKDGLACHCKACKKAYRDKHKAEKAEYGRKHRQENKVKTAKYDRKYYRAHKEQIAARMRRWAQANRAEIAKKNRIYYQMHKAEVSTHMREYYRENKAACVKRARERDVRVADLPGFWTAEQWNMLCSFFQLICPACGEPVETFSVDHVIPVTWPNSSNDIANIQPLCLSCNKSKGNRSDADYRPWQVIKWAYAQSDLF